MQAKKMLASYLMIVWCIPVYAEVMTDGSLGAIKNLSGQMTIPQNLGKTAGSNLFHSFKTFNINIGESAMFTGADNLENVISRVTGGSLSSINGLLKSEIGNANFYFINPAGITFGANAQVDVPAAFHISTANTLHFNNGDSFNASLAILSTLSVADPVGFGFLGKQAGDIKIVGSQLEFKPGTTFSLTAGNLVINAAAKLITQSGGSGGDMQLYAVGNSATDVTLTHSINSALSGQLTIDASSLDVSGNSSGYLQLNAGDISVNNVSTLFANNTGDKNANSNKGINIVANNLNANDSLILANTLGNGKGGNITAILFNQFNLFSDQVLKASSFGTRAGNKVRGVDFITHTYPAKGDAGNVKVNAKTLTVSNISSLSSDVVAGSTGDGGNIDITANEVVNSGLIINSANIGKAGNITITGGKVINLGAISNSADIGDAGYINIKANEVMNSGFIYTQAGNSGNAGYVRIETNKLQVNNGGWIESSTSKAGNAGNIKIKANDILIDTSTINSGTTSTGNAGSLIINTKTLTLSNGANIRSNTLNSGNAGKITIHADSIKIDGTRSTVSSSIAAPNSTGQAGSVDIVAKNTIEILNGGWLRTDSIGTKSAGSISLKANEIKMDNGVIYNVTSGNQDDGNVGTVTIKGNKLTMLNSSAISAFTSGSGNAGNITVGVKDVLLDNSYIDSSNFPFSSSENLINTGNSGNLSITGDRLSVLNGSAISTGGFNANAGHISISEAESVDFNDGHILNEGLGYGNTANAGKTSIKTDKLSLTHNSSIDSKNIDGKGGTVNLDSKYFTLTDGSFISTNTEGSGDGGNIIVTTDNMMIDRQNSNSLTGLSSNALVRGVKSKAGDITVTVNDKLSILGGGIISTSTLSDLGDAGNININAGNLLIDGLGKSTGSIDIKVIKPATQNSDGTFPPPSFETKTILLPRPISPGISSDNFFSSGRAGTVDVSATKTLEMTHGGIISSDTLASGEAGYVTVNADNINLLDNSTISSNTSAAGKAGDITVTATTLSLDNAAIKATAEKDSTGIAGSVTVDATQSLKSSNSASINSSTFGTGKAGDVTVNTPNLILDSQAEISALAGVGSNGQTGAVQVNANNINLSNGGKISVQNDGIAREPEQTKPSDLTLNVPVLAMSGGIITAATSGNVDAGNIAVNTSTPLLLNSGASIESSTQGNGNAGNITVTAPTINLDHASITAKTTANGHAGTVTVKADNSLTTVNNASINSSTSSSGSAGSVAVNAPVILIDNVTISAEATTSSSGQTGDVTVTATKSLQLSNQGKITIQNDATVPNPAAIKAGVITVSAPDIDLKNSKITAESTGNVDAGNIYVNFSHWLTLDPSYITTSANLGNGGTITIKGGELINLQNSGFLTSVTGANGNGGNINVAADIAIMNTGVIQANAVGGSGGDIGLNLKALIPSYNSLIKGGTKVTWQPYKQGLNVIQAVSETGVNGNINLASPQFDISGAISGLDASGLILPTINRSPCQLTSGSSLARKTKGSVPVTETKQVFVAPITVSESSADSSSLDSDQQSDNRPCLPISPVALTKGN